PPIPARETSNNKNFPASRHSHFLAPDSRFLTTLAKNMPNDNHNDLERSGREAQMETKPTRSPLGLFKGSVESLTRCLSRSSKESQPSAELPTKRYVHTPTHAAASHLKTTRTRNMDRANEVL